MSEARSILVCDDNIDHLMLMRREIEKFPGSFQVSTVSTAAACLQELEHRLFDVVVIDYLLRDRNGLDLLREVTARFPTAVSVMITGMGNEDVAVQAMKSGAGDYVIKSTGSFAVVPLVIARALERRALLDTKRELEKQASQAGHLSLLGALALGVAHDVNQLLGTILGRVQLMRERTDDPTFLAQLGVAETAARDAGAIVQRILDFSRPGSSQPVESLALAQLIEDCLEFTRSRWEADAQRRGVTYQVINEVASDLTVAAHPAQLREVITNVIVNALEAMPDGGTLILRGRHDPVCVRLSIQDTGIGMDRETAARVFEPLFTRGKLEGQGIGLATSRAIIESMGGRIEVESERDVGTTFTLVLGRRAEGGKAAPTAPVDVAPVAGQHILVVDNEPRVAALMFDILVSDRHSAAIAYSGEEAMGKFKPGDCDILICDLSLPGMNGLDVARAARALDPAVAIVLVTGWGNEAALATAEPKVVDLVAAKPLDVAQVRELVRQAALLVTRRRRSPDGEAPARDRPA